jgi:hypothetical protein
MIQHIEITFKHRIKHGENFKVLYIDHRFLNKKIKHPTQLYFLLMQ